MSNVEVHLSGSLFSNPDAAFNQWATDVATTMGKHALAEVGQIMDASFRNPTPYYETQVVMDPMTDGVVVHDRGIVYGPWLEGVGSRNARTRFKGYHMFRTTRDRLERDADGIVSRMIAEFVRRIS